MNSAHESRTVADIAAEIEAKTSRVAELKRQASVKTLRVDNLQNLVNGAVAKGEDASKHRKELRDVRDELDGIQGALGMLDAELKTLESQRDAANIDEAKGARDAALKEWGEIVDNADARLSQLLNDELGDLYESALDASRRVYEAENQMNRFGQRVFSSAMSHPDRHSQSWGRAIPLIAAIKDNSEGKPYHANWGQSTSVSSGGTDLRTVRDELIARQEEAKKL